MTNSHEFQKIVDLQSFHDRIFTEEGVMSYYVAGTNIIYCEW